MSEANRPILPGERILALDVFRGIAMFGVLTAYSAWSLGTLPEDAYSSFDRALDRVMTFTVDNKAYTLLAFLFGLGFQLQLCRAGGNDGETVRLYRRRLLVLAAIGLVHALLLRNGDILLPYALTGLLLVPFRNASDRTLIMAALLILLSEFAVRILWAPLGLPLPERPNATGQPYLVENFAWVRYWYLTAIFNWPLNLTLFLFGFLAGRSAWLMRIAAKRGRIVWLLVAGLAAGAGFFAASLALSASLNNSGTTVLLPFATLLYTFHAWGMASAYAALILLVLSRPAGRIALSPFAAVGRMALTNYLMQAAVIVPLCLLLGWFDRFTPTRALLLVAVYFPIQVIFSLFWLRRHDFGPAEWLWRLLTYGKLPRSPRAGEEAGATL